MFISTESIVLRTYPFKDKKFITKVFTREAGLVSFIFRKTKNQVVLAQPLTMLDITYRSPKNKQLFYITEAHINYAYQNLLFNNNKINHSIILCEILYKCLQEPNEALFDFIIESFKWFDTNRVSSPLFNNFFLVKFCEKMGISPFNKNLEEIPLNYVLNMADGNFIQPLNTIIKDIVPHDETIEMHILSKISIGELVNYKSSKKMNSIIFNYLVKYISIHLTDISNLKATSIVKEIY